MSLKALFYAYVLGGLTFLPLLILGAIFYTVYTSVPIGDLDPDKLKKRELPLLSEDEGGDALSTTSNPTPSSSPSDLNDLPRPRKGWLTMRRTFEESQTDASYVDMVRGFLDSRSKDPKRSRPKDTWYVALKGKVLYLYEDESMTECEAAIELGGHDVVVFPEGLTDGELFAKRNAICLKPKGAGAKKDMLCVTRDMRLGEEEHEDGEEEKGESWQRQQERELQENARELAFDASMPWFIFVRSVVEMEDWYLALVHASANPANTPTLDPLRPVYQPDDMSHLVARLDEQPDVIPMRWLNALIGRIFFSYYRTQTLESYIIGRLMKKISKVKRPTFLTDIKVREVSVGNRAPTFSKPMLKELTKEGDASLEVHVAYKGEIRITVEATATINLGARFKTYVVKLVLALVVREIEGNLLVKVKRPPSSRIWYAFTQMPNIVMEVEPVVSDRQITWGMILSTIESKVKEVIYESVVLPNMDDISFFESSQYEHRGGIWADASRQEQAQTLSGEQPTTTDETNTPPTHSSEASKSDVADTQRPAIPRSQSAEEVQQTTTGTSPPDAAPVPRANTTDAALSMGTSTAAKRRTWFSSGEGESNVSAAPPPNAVLPDEQSTRGRRLDADTIASRRSSLPNFNGLLETPGDRGLHSDDAFEDARRLAPTLPNRRSPSEHSRSASSRATSISSSHAGDVSDEASESQLANFRSKSPANGATSPRQTAANQASTFFQTLKTRAGDKQALSNTAKETMRKWGVSWGNFRRDAIGGAGSGQSDEVPDAGHGDQRRPDSRSSTVRPSYADLRAAVEERREKEQRVPSQEPSSRSNEASEPISVVPQSTSAMEKQRAGSASPGSSSAPVDNSPASSNNVMKPGVSAMPRPESPNLLERTESQVSSSSQQSASHMLGIVPVEEVNRPLSTIHTQPLPPKTMTIPGIHASHRGEVMSMGYAPPPPPVVPLDPKKAPLQSVYRLWKNPASGSGAAPIRGELAPVSQTGFTGHDQDSSAASPPTSDASTSEDVSSTVTSPAPLPPRPVPPPLPPRAAQTNALSKPEVPRPSEGDSSSVSSSTSRASAALQSIASKDREKRASLTGTPPGASVAPSPGQNSDASRSAEAADGSPGQESSDSADRSESMEPSSSSPSTASASASASATPTPSHTPSPPTSAGRGPPPALPPRRPVRTLA